MPNDKHGSLRVRVAVAQLGPVLGDLERNRARASEAIEEAASARARLVVLPELCNSGYAFTDADEARGLAERLDGPTVSGWHQLAARHRLVVVGGLCELDDEGELRNTAVVVDPDGLRAAYRKTHLWDREKLVFTEGDAPPPVVDTLAGHIGVAICYDAVFPELFRQLALDGADIVAVPMNSPLDGAATEPVPIEIALVMAAANSNRMYIAQADRTRHERGIDWAEASVVVDADGGVLAGPAAGEGVLVATCDLARARDKSWGERNHLFDDRRTDIYKKETHT